MNVVEHPGNENGASHEDDPSTAKKILKQIHSKLHSRHGSQDDDPRDPEESGPVRKLVRRACRKLHIQKECSVNKDGTCRYDQFQALQELFRKKTNEPITDEESRIITDCIATMSDEQAKIVESWFKEHREQPPDYTERAGGEAEASGSTPVPSRRAESESNDTNIAEHTEQGGDVEASGSASRPSRRPGSGPYDTNIVEHAGNFEQGGGEGEGPGSVSRSSGRAGSNSHDANVAELTERPRAEQGEGEGETSGSASRPSRREGSGSYGTTVTEYIENVEQAGREGETPGTVPRPSGQVGCVAEHVEHAQQGGGRAEAARPSPGPPDYSTSVSRGTDNNTISLQGGPQAEASGSTSRRPRRVTFESQDGEDGEEGGRSGSTPSISNLMKRVRGRLHIS
ncbi:hypothetical protein MMC15_005077 [Xylographa vitiligo]|nr:hypothetical protein [Xylographa vitiligo]